MPKSEEEPLLRPNSDQQSGGLFYGSNEQSVNDLRSSRTYLSPQRNHHILTSAIILFIVLLERVAFYALTGNLFLFLNQDPYNWLSYNAMNAVLIFTGVAYVSSLFGGWFADSLLGRFKTIVLAFVIFAIAYIFIFLLSESDNATFQLNLCHNTKEWYPITNSTYPDSSSLFEERCSWQIFIFLIFAGIGSGTVKANITPFGADQVRFGGPDSLRIFFNWFYWCVNIGAFVAIGGISYIQQTIDFHWGYGIPSVCLLVATMLFLIAYPLYVKQPPTGSVITRVLAILKEAWKSNHRLKSLRNLNDDNTRSIQVSNSNPSWLDMAKVRYGGKFHEAAVEDVKSLCTVFIVFAALIPYWLLYFQMQTTFQAQGLHMKLSSQTNCSHNNITTGEKEFSIPAAWLTLFDIIFLIIFIPLMDRVIYPWLDKRGIRIPMLTRISLGMIFAALSMFVAGGVETYRLNLISKKNETICQIIGNTPYNAADMWIFWQIPQYALIGLSEVFASVAGMEFAFTQASRSSQGIIMGLFFFCAGIGSFIGSGLVMAIEPFFLKRNDRRDINQGHLNYYFFLLGGIQTVTLIIFIFVSKKLKTRKPPASIDSRTRRLSFSSTYATRDSSDRT